MLRTLSLSLFNGREGGNLVNMISAKALSKSERWKAIKNNLMLSVK